MIPPCDCPDRVVVGERRVLLATEDCALALEHAEVFTWTTDAGRRYAFNVTLAQQIVGTGLIEQADQETERPHAWVSCVLLLQYSADDAVDPRHVLHVDPTKPGIAVPLWGEDDGTHCVIDGRHRAARMLQLYGPTAELGVYLLTPAETARCVLLMPSGD